MIKQAHKLRLIYFFAYACAVCWVPVLALYYKKAGITGFQIGILSSIPPAILFIVQPFWGFWADMLGRKKLLIVVMCLSASIFWFFREKAGFGSLLMLTVALGLFWSTVHPLIDCITLDMISDRTERSFNFFRMWGSIGWSVGSLCMSYIDLSDNLVFNFRLASVFLMISLIIVFTLGKATTEKDLNEQDLKPGHIRILFSNRLLIVFLILILFIAILTAPIWYYTSILYHDIGASSSLISFVFGIQGMVEIPFFFIANRLINRFGLKQMLLLSFFCNGLRSLLYAIVPNPQWALGIELLQGISWSLLWVCCIEYVNDIVPSEWRATGQSLLWAVFFGIGTIIGNLWTGYLYELIPIRRIFLYNSIGLFIFSILVTIMLFRNKSNKYAEMTFIRK